MEAVESIGTGVNRRGVFRTYKLGGMKDLG